MTTIRRFRMTDTLRFNNVNLDHLTETFQSAMYNHYFNEWPELCQVAQAPSGGISGYMLAKVEGNGDQWHGHVSAVTVAPSYRRLGLARLLMHNLENSSDVIHNAYFVDLYVRASNYIAVQMYKSLGYVVYRRVLKYYNNEDAYDMRRACSRDVDKKSEIPAASPAPPQQDIDYQA